MSLRLRAVVIAGISLVLLWVVAATWMMRGVHTNIDRTLDGRLAMSARMVSGLLERAALTSSTIHSGFSQAMQVTGNEGIACEIRLLRGEVLARTTSGPQSDMESLPVGLSTNESHGSQWRIYVLRANGYQITTAERIDQRDELIAEILRAAGVPFLIAIFGGLAALWLGIGQGLAPLKALCLQLRSRQADDTAHIAVHRAPAELRPVIDAMNGLLGRLAHALSSQRAFTDAAAHELRTPLTVIDTHLQVIRLTEGDEAEASLVSAEEGVRRLRRTLDQMMVLARTEAPVHDAGCCTSVLAAVKSVVSQVDSVTPGRLTLIAGNTDAPARVPKSMLEAAIRNLVDNAIRYSPAHVPVEIAVNFDFASGRCRIAIADRGSGLSEAQIGQMGRRFWRGDQGRAHHDGAGLGISIVRSIVQRFGGSLTLSPRAGGGLSAEIMLTLYGAK